MKVPFLNGTINYVNEKAIQNVNSILTNNIDVIGSDYREQNYLIENLYKTFARDLSMLNFKIAKSTGKAEDYEVLHRDLTYLLDLRPNQLQSSTEFWNTFAYNTIKYGNGIALIERGENNKVVSLENVDVGSMTFGFGYDDKNGLKYLVWKDLTSNETRAIDYRDVIHVRYIPSNIFKGDYTRHQDFNKIVDIIDMNVNSMIHELGQGGKIKGILELKSALGNTKLKKDFARNFSNNFGRETGGIATLDIGEKFTPLTTEFAKVSSDDIDELLKYVYNAFGIPVAIVNGDYTNEQYKAYYNKVLEPIIKQISDELNYKLLEYEDYMNYVKIKVNKNLLTAASVTDIAAVFDKGIYQAVFSPNEEREALGYDAYVGGDIIQSNLNAAPITSKGGD